MSALRNVITGLAADNDRTEEVRIEGKFNLVISGTWTGNIVVLRKFDYNNILVTQDGGDGQALLTDSSSSFVSDELIGMYISNDSDGSIGPITDNSVTTITATLAGGTQNDWDDTEVGSLWQVIGTYTTNQVLSGEEIRIGTKYMVLFDRTSGTVHAEINQNS